MSDSRSQRIREIFEAALERPESERMVWVAQACGDDEAMRQRIEELLSAQQNLGEFLEYEQLTETVGGVRNTAEPAARDEMVGPYRIVSELGRGGMGVVYKAEDPRLGRFVALKFLPPYLLATTKGKQRLLAEARAASKLDHPNICTVHDIGETPDGRLFFAMAYYEGETLADRIKRGPLDVEQSREIAREVALGLAAAHDVGVIHRDIKPSNIYLTARGEVKILDFGVAQHGIEALTDAGSVIGTVGYMPPEALLNKKVDVRGDLWSLGVTLYEMLTGRLPFAGDNNAAALYAIAHEKPRPLGEEIPKRPRQILDKLLAKERDERYQDARQLIADLDGPLDVGLGERVVPEKTSGERVSMVVIGWVLSAGLLLILGYQFGWWQVSSEFDKLAAPVPLTSLPGREENASFSPDGERVAFSWNGDEDGSFNIYVKSVPSGAPQRLTSDVAWDSSPAWAPDGERIAFLRERAGGLCDVMLIPRIGEAERRITRIETLVRHGLSWSPDGRQLAVADTVGLDERPAVVLVTVETGEKRTVSLAPVGAVAVRQPVISPDGTKIAFDVVHGGGLGDTYLVPVSGGEPKRLTFLTGEPDGLAWFTDSERLIFARSSAQASRALWVASASGGEPIRLNLGENQSQPAIAPRGDKLVLSKRESRYDIRRIDTRKGGAGSTSHFISSTRFDGNPQYSPDGTRIVFSSSRSGNVEIWTCDADGSNVVQLTSLGVTGSPRWSPAGDWIVFDSVLGENADVWVVSSTGGEPRRITTNAAEDVVPSWSRDGEWLYFASNRTGEYRIWKIATAGEPEAEALPVTATAGFYPAESVDGKRVFYVKKLSGETPICAQPVGGGEETVVIEDVRSGWGNWVVAPNGIYVVNPREHGPADSEWAVFFHPFDGRGAREVARLGPYPTRGGAGLGVSPDGRWILNGQVTVSSDLMLVEGRW